MRFQKFMKSKALNGYVDIYNVGYRVPAYEEQIVQIQYSLLYSDLNVK